MMKKPLNNKEKSSIKNNPLYNDSCVPYKYDTETSKTIINPKTLAGVKIHFFPDGVKRSIARTENATAASVNSGKKRRKFMLDS